MAKKLKGDYFYLTANDLKTGSVVYYCKNKWSSKVFDAIKISRLDLEKYEKIAQNYERKCYIVSPFFIELDEIGKIRKMRDKIRQNGITFKL
tara:strand:+ start:850 stop:1125 length:276 start_codon:yes stop_codon:yes gene_type:complete